MNHCQSDPNPVQGCARSIFGPQRKYQTTYHIRCLHIPCDAIQKQMCSYYKGWRSSSGSTCECPQGDFAECDLSADAVSIGGGYTNTDPESRRITVVDTKGRVKVKVVYVVLEAQYQSSLSTGEVLVSIVSVQRLRHVMAAWRAVGSLRKGSMLNEMRRTRTLHNLSQMLPVSGRVSTPI